MFPTNNRYETAGSLRKNGAYMASDTITLDFTKKPSPLASYGKLIAGKRKGLKPGESLPSISARWADVEIDPLNLKSYNRSCGLDDSEFLPLLYPHIIAAPLHLSMVSHPAFPLKMMGSIHLSNHILQHRRLRVSEKIDIDCFLGGKRNVEKGLEFDIETKVSVKNERVWESITTALIRGRFGEEEKGSDRAKLSMTEDAVFLAEWAVPAGTGRRYAGITGDFNPIHLFPLTAKLFGFKRDIAHGMWSLANAVGRLDMSIDDRPVRIDAAFKGPMFMANTARLHSRSDESGRKFDVYCSGNPKPVICGDIRWVEPGVSL